MEDPTLFQPRTVGDIYSSQIFAQNGQRIRVSIDFRENPTGITCFSKNRLSSTQICFDVPAEKTENVQSKLSEISDTIARVVGSSGVEFDSVTPLLNHTNQAYPPFITTTIPKTDFSQPTGTFAFLADTQNNHLNFHECKEKEVVYADMFVDSVVCKNRVLTTRLQLVQAVFSDVVRDRKIEIPAHNLTQTIRKEIVVSKASASNVNFVYQITGDNNMIVVRFGGGEGGMFPISYSFSPPTDSVSSKGRVKFEVYNQEELSALLELESKIIAATKKCKEVGISESDTVEFEGLTPDNYVKGLPLLMSSKIDVTNATVCVDTDGKPVALEKLGGCKFKYIDVYMSNVYTKKVRSYVTVGVCKKIKQIVVYAPPEPIYVHVANPKKRKFEHESSN